MKITAFIMVFSGLAAFLSCSSVSSLEEQAEALVADLDLPPNAHLEIVLTKIRDHLSLPGIAAAAVTPERVLEVSTIGFADSERRIDLGLDHRFDINSVTKSFTALVIAGLVEEGSLEYDRPVVEVFPGLAGRIHGDYEGLTIDELLHHTAGLSRNGEHIAGSERPGLDGSMMENRARIARWVLGHPAGARRGEFSYSNIGYIILGAVIEKTTGRSWETEVEERVFEPLAMSSGSFGWIGGDVTHYAIGHRRNSGGGFVQRTGHDDWYLYGTGFPMGGIHLSVRDFATYAQYHLKGVAGRVEDLPRSTFRGLHRIEGLYGRGWFGSEFADFPGSVHDGSDDGYYSKIFVSGELELGIVVLANIDDENAWRACNGVTYWLLRKYAKSPRATRQDR